MGLPNIIRFTTLLHLEHLCLFSFDLSPGTDADGLIRNQRWKNWWCFIFLSPWLVSYLFDMFDIWKFVHIGSGILVSWSSRIFMLLKGPIGGIVHRLTMLFQLIRPHPITTKGAENKCSSLWAIG